MSKTLKLLEKFRKEFVVLGGDFNVTLEPRLDTSTEKSSLSFKVIKYVKQLFRSLHLVDRWWVLHAEKKYYSYYSKTHNVYSRLDLILVDQYYLNYVRSATIQSITVSDHTSITKTSLPVSGDHRERTWRLNETLLDDRQEDLLHKLVEYFEINTSGEESEQTVWEAHKAAIRGELIAHGSHVKRKKWIEIMDLLEKIQEELEIRHKANLDQDDARHLETLRIELSGCLDRRAKEKHRYFVHRFYEQGNKCGRLLDGQLKKQQELGHVHNILVNDKQVVDTKSIAGEFH